MWWPLTNVNPSACSGVTVQTPSCSDIRQCRGWIEGPNSCNALVFAEPTSTGSVVNFTRRPPSPECVISISTGPSRSAVILPPLLIPRGFFLRLRGWESAGRRRTWNMMDPGEENKKKGTWVNNSIKVILLRHRVRNQVEGIQKIHQLFALSMKNSRRKWSFSETQGRLIFHSNKAILVAKYSRKRTQNKASTIGIFSFVDQKFIKKSK